MMRDECLRWFINNVHRVKPGQQWRKRIVDMACYVLRCFH